MADPDSTPDANSVSGSPSEVSQLLREIAHAPKIAGALRDVVLPTPLRGIELGGPALDPSVPRVGTVIAERYRLDALLGAGGMGVVFAAIHVETEKPVALKWLLLQQRERNTPDHARALARFAREARVAGRIRHPNVVDVYDACSEERTPYLVMERLEGETLRARIERAPLTWDETTTLLLPALRGVAEVHRQGIVHRDLKPDNVFLARVNGTSEPCAKVLDFGVSRLRSHDSVEDSLTRTGAIVGTPSYMPLEQLRGEDGVDQRTDVYALGVVLFESLTGRRPWQARTAAEYGALLATGRPTRLSVLLPELKGAREAVIMKALERDPEDRYPNVEAMIAALEAAAQPHSRRARLSLALAACGMLGLAGWQLLGPPKPTPGSARLPTPSVLQARPLPPERTAPSATEIHTIDPVDPMPVTQVTPAAASSSLAGGSFAPRPRVRQRTNQADAGANGVDQVASPAERALDLLQPPEIPAVAQPTDRATALDRGQF